MFINYPVGPNFKALKVKGLILSAFFFLFFSSYAQQALRGLVVESDNATPMPFVYIINKSSGHGTMSDNEGRFSLVSNINDTLLCSYVGFLKEQIPVKQLTADEKGLIRIKMVPLPVNLGAVTVTGFRIKPYEREYMQDIIDQSLVRNVDYIRSPISALYMQYSKEGRQIRKLAKIFEDLLVEEQVQKKLNREILVRLTGDESIDYIAFRKYCYYVNDYYIAEHDGVELYSRVMDCYKRFKAEGRDQPPKRREPQTGN